jgi:predicted XRE-type DNA-binding protein
MKRECYASVWDAIEPDPAVRENLKLRSELMLAIRRMIEKKGLTQTAAAEIFGVTQPRISNLMKGKINAFGLDLLVRMATTAGLRVSMKVSKAA